MYLKIITLIQQQSNNPMPEGRVLDSAGTFTQEFIMTDQQGNARVAFRNKGGIAKVFQENSYYGTGLILPNSPVSTPSVANKKLYNGGSEWQNDSPSGTYNLPDYYQTFNRNYDAAIGRWTSIDPKAENTNFLSAYQYANDNPLAFNDPMGDLSQLQWNQVIQIYDSGPITENRKYEDGITGYFLEDDSQNLIGYVPGGGGGGGNYTVDSNGKIVEDTNNPVVPEAGKDILWAIGTKTFNYNDPFLAVSDGILESQQPSVTINGQKLDYFTVNDNIEATSIFEFLAQNTSVEWALIRFDGFSNYIATSHQETHFTGVQYLINSIWENGGYVTEVIHDHPHSPGVGFLGGDLYGPSGFRPDDPTPFHGDKGVAQEYDFVQFGFENNFQPIYWQVYDVNSHYYFQYNGIGIQNDLTPEEYFNMVYKYF